MLKNVNIEDIKNIALKAGQIIMEIYNKDFTVEYKDDKSPLTEADTKSNEFICKALEELYPNIPIMSEENKQVDYEIRKYWEYYWCIDPIDGTKEFIKKNDEFTVNIALIHKDTPVLGVVYAPAIDKIYWAKKNEGAYLEVLGARCEVLSKNKLPLTDQKNLKEKITVVPNIGFSREDRNRHMHRIGHLIKTLQNNSVSTVASFVSPYRESRKAIRDMVKNNVVVYVKADTETCKIRDYKGVYKKALNGELQNFTGISDVYEEPQYAEIIIDTDKVGINEAVNIISRYIKNNYVK